ncbi:MAG: PDZ domain-containing protein [Rikenellaceae bacterium]|jgi:carboxyl-terminal processing protease|nr:PDZ domain-containing protein [Rikenellaceae bacterium]
MKKTIFTIVAYLSLLAVQAQSPLSLFSRLAQPDSRSEATQKMNQFLYFLGGSYVDTLDMSELVDGAIVEMLSELDPHSAYISAEEMQEVEESFNANFEGIGIEFNVLKDTVIVVNTIPGGPSERVGLLPNDRIVAAGDSTLVGVKQTDVPKILRGPKGTIIPVEVVRQGVPERLKFRIERDKIPIHTLDAAYKVDDRTGYVKLNRFAATTNDELQQALTAMGTLDALILDLRGNGGGYLDQAVQVSNTFLPRGSVVVSMEGRAVPSETLKAPNAPSFGKGKLIVLVDEFSASASEIVAGAVQDWDRGLILGRPTFGKGLVQRQYPLTDGSAVRITVARYHTPSGRVIQRPYEKGKTEEYYLQFSQRFTTDSLEAFPDSLKYKTLRGGRTVYGGGGITPDILVSRDTVGYTAYWAKLRNQSVVSEYVIDYMDKNRRQLERRYPSFEAFDAEFNVDAAMLDDLVALGTERGVEYVAEEMEESRGLIAVQLKALIAQRLWTTTEYYRIINRGMDEFFARAMEVLADWETSGQGIVAEGSSK